MTRIDDHHPPGAARPRRFVPRFHWELLVCGVAGHELLGVDAAVLRPEDGVFAREVGGTRWFRCLRREREADMGRDALGRTAPPPYASALAQASSSTLSGGAASRGT